jgi:hypothetical protein
MSNTTSITAAAERALAYAGGNPGEFIVDYFEPWVLAIHAELSALASKHGCTIDSPLDRAGSRYVDITAPAADEDSIGESICVRLSNHAQAYAGPVWSFELSDDASEIERGLRAVENAIVEMLD